MSSSRQSSASSIRSISSIKPKIPHQLPKISAAKIENENQVSFATDLNEQDIKDDKAFQRYEIMMRQLNEISAKKNQIKDTKRVPSGKLTPLSPTANKCRKLNIQVTKINDKCTENAMFAKKNRLSPLRQDESDSEDSGSDADFRKSLKAPNELLQEFLVYVMEKKWEDAHKLCSFILMYEPNNKTAKEFLPLIESKLSESSEDDTESSESSDEDEDDEENDTDNESDEEETDSDQNIDSGNDNLVDNNLT